MKKNKSKYVNGGQIGTVVGAGLGVAAGALIPGAQPFIPQLGAIGGSLGGAVGRTFDESDAPMQPAQPYVSPKPYGVYKNGGSVKSKMKYVNGGSTNKQVINVEKDELEVTKGRVLSDYTNKPKHPSDGSLDPKGNVSAREGSTIIPANKRTDYLRSGIEERKTIEKQVDKRSNSAYVGKYATGGEVVAPIIQGVAPYVDNIVNAGVTANTPEIAAPVLNQNVNLNNQYSIRPQLNDAEALRRATMQDVASRTNSASVYRASAGDVYARSLNNRNNLYNQKNNIETQLGNQEILTNAQINQGNNAAINNYNMQQTMRQDDIGGRISANAANLAGDMQGQIRDKNFMNNELLKTAMIYQVFNTNGVLDRSKVLDILQNSNSLTPSEREKLTTLLTQSQQTPTE